MSEQRFLISDIGGTNIRIASFADDPRKRGDEEIYKLNPETGKPFGVIEALQDYRLKHKFKICAACLGVAGRVKAGQVQITNRPDLIRRKDVAEVLGVNELLVLLVNDMPPHLASVDRLLPEELITVLKGKGDPKGTRGVLMPGTGVGVGGSVFVRGVNQYLPFPSEGGHIDFAPRDEQQDRLLRYLRLLALKSGLSNVSNEFVFCGEGIRRIYAFLNNPDSLSFASIPTSEAITTAVAAGDLPADDLRARTIELYLKILGAAAGNLALLFTATGGIFLGGSICLAIRKQLLGSSFVGAFLNSGPPAHRPLLEEVPVQLIDYKDSGLLGTGVMAKSLV